MHTHVRGWQWHWLETVRFHMGNRVELGGRKRSIATTQQHRGAVRSVDVWCYEPSHCRPQDNALHTSGFWASQEHQVVHCAVFKTNTKIQSASAFDWSRNTNCSRPLSYLVSYRPWLACFVSSQGRFWAPLTWQTRLFRLFWSQSTKHVDFCPFIIPYRNRWRNATAVLFDFFRQAGNGQRSKNL